jgi:hypothetical protein
MVGSVWETHQQIKLADESEVAVVGTQKCMRTRSAGACDI